MFWSQTASWDTMRDMPSLSGKVAIVTGGNSGIGKECVKHLASHGAKVYLAARNEVAVKATIEELEKEVTRLVEENAKDARFSEGKIEPLKLDLCDLKGCINAAREFLSKEDRLDILINNAAVMGAPYSLTKDGFEVQFQTNHLGHFAFTLPLLPLLVRTSRLPSNGSDGLSGVRIIQVSSRSQGDVFFMMNDPVPSSAATGGNRKGLAFVTKEDVNREFGFMGQWKRYGQSKMCNVLFARELNKRIGEKERVWSNSVHPGPINTNLTRYMPHFYPYLKPVLLLTPLILKSPYDGAVTQLYAATAKEVEEKNIRGEYLLPMAQVGRAYYIGYDDSLAKELWEFSVKMVKEATGEDIDYTNDGN